MKISENSILRIKSKEETRGPRTSDLKELYGKYVNVSFDEREYSRYSFVSVIFNGKRKFVYLHSLDIEGEFLV